MKIYEAVDSTNDEMHWTLGYWTSLDDALAAVDIPDPRAIGCRDHDDWDDTCVIEIREHEIGWGGTGKCVRRLEWVGEYDESADEYKLRRKGGEKIVNSVGPREYRQGNRADIDTRADAQLRAVRAVMRTAKRNYAGRVHVATLELAIKEAGKKHRVN